jgi:hypothetical protein
VGPLGGALFSTAKQIYTTSKFASQFGGAGTTFHVSYATPSNFYEDSVNKQRIEVRSSESKSTHTTDAKSYGGGTSFQVGLWSVGASASGTDKKEHFDSETEDISIGFDMSTVLINRPWMDTTLFKLDGWSVSGQKSDSISDGKSLDTSEKMMPYVSTALIIAHDIKIKGDWSKEDRDKIESSLSTSASVGYGPFKVKGNYSQQHGKEFSSNMSADGTIRIPAAQVIGVIMAKMPEAAKLSGKGE